MCYEKQELLTHREHLSSLLGFWWGPFCPSFKFFSVVLLCILTFWVPCCDVRYDFRIKRSSVNLYLQLFVGGLMSYLPPVVCGRAHVLFTSSCLWEGSCLIYVICDCLRIVVSNTYCGVFLFCLSSSCVLCTQCCQFLWIVRSWLNLRFL